MHKFLCQSLRHQASRCYLTTLSQSFSTSRPFASSPISVDLNKMSLKEPIGFHHQKPLQLHSKIPSLDYSKTQITQLSNGIRVASQNAPGIHCSLGVIIHAGPRHEVDSISGVSHYLEKLAFHSSENLSDRNAFEEEMEKCNAIFDCQISKDFIVYAVSGLNANVGRMTELLSETIFRSKLSDDEVDMAGRSVGFELQALEMRPPVEPVLTDLVHSAAFGAGSNTLGLPRYCPKENIGVIGRNDLLRFISTYYRPDRMVVAAAGVDHDQLVKAVEAFFSPQCKHSLAVDDAPEPDDSLAQYTGGVLRVHRDLERYHAPMPEFTHIALGLPSCGLNDDDYVGTCLLQSLLGGGGSFSAGGPGKGMYTRFYTGILNQYSWVNSARADNHVYSDCGLFCLYGSTHSFYIGQLAVLLARQLRYLVEGAPVMDDEWFRAKHQLKSSLLMNLEGRPGSFEDIARQVLFSNRRHSPAYWAEQIDAVTIDHIREVIDRMIRRAAPAVVGFGNIECLQSDEDLSQLFTTTLTEASTSSLLLKIKRTFNKMQC